MSVPDLEREIDVALRRLAAPRAPRTLTPRVMAAVRRREQAPWYRRPWFSWPALGRAAVAGAAMTLIAAAAWWLPSAFGMTADTLVLLGATVGRYLSWTPPESVQRVLDAIGAAQALWRALLGPLLMYASAFAVVMGGVFALCAALLTRVTLGRATI